MQNVKALHVTPRLYARFTINPLSFIITEPKKNEIYLNNLLLVQLYEFHKSINDI